MRRQLVTSDAAELQPHDHAVWCGNGPRDLHRLASAVFSSAAARNELMIFVAEPPRREWLIGIDDVDRLVERGALRLIDVGSIYGSPIDAAAQEIAFERLADEALATGYSGVCVVADNTRLIGQTEADFRAWLAWETLADQLQATRPITGVCYFDRHRVPDDRLADLATMHPVRFAQVTSPLFLMFSDADGLRVVGQLDALLADQIRRVVGTVAAVTARDVDIRDLEFIDHRALSILDELARSGAPVRLRGANRLVRRVWELLDLPAPALELV